MKNGVGGGVCTVHLFISPAAGGRRGREGGREGRDRCVTAHARVWWVLLAVCHTPAEFCSPFFTLGMAWACRSSLPKELVLLLLVCHAPFLPRELCSRAFTLLGTGGGGVGRGVSPTTIPLLLLFWFATGDYCRVVVRICDVGDEREGLGGGGLAGGGRGGRR